MGAINRDQLHKAIDELPDDRLEELEVYVSYLQHRQTRPGSAWFRELYDLFAPVREEVEHMGLSEAEVDQIIDEAIAESRHAADD